MSTLFSAVFRILMLRPAVAAGNLPALSALKRLEPRALHVALLLLILALLNAVDLAYTLFAHHIGQLNEMNPVADSFLSQGLEPSLICYKLLMLLAGSTMLFRVRRSGWAVPACWILILAYCVLAVIWYLWVGNIVWLYEARLTWYR